MKKLLTWLPVLLVAAGLIYRGAIAEGKLDRHEVDIRQLKDSTAALLKVNLKNETSKAAKAEQQLEMCRSGQATKTFCANRGLPHPKLESGR